VTLVCAVKSYCTRRAVEISGMCREKCGGQGLISSNKIADLNNVAASLVVVEGDSMLLAQKVSKEILDFRTKGGALKMYATSKLKSWWCQSKIYYGGSNSVNKRKFHAALLEAREEILILQIADAIQGSRKKGIPLLEAWSKHHLDLVVHLHKAFTERLFFKKFCEEIDNPHSLHANKLLRSLCDLYVLSAVEEDLGWYLTYTPMDKATSIAIGEELKSLCLQFSYQDALQLVNCFHFPEELITAPIANKDAWQKVME